MADPIHAFEADGTPSPGAQIALDGKAAASHSHTWGAITGKPTTFNPAAHTHSVSDVTGLQTELNGKADSSHSHTWAQVTGKPSTFPPSSHEHDVDDIAGLADRLAALEAGGGSGRVEWFGTVTVPTTNMTGTQTVTFPEGMFTGNPIVFVSKQGSANARAVPYATTIRPTGCTVGLYDPTQEPYGSSSIVVAVHAVEHMG